MLHNNNKRVINKLTRESLNANKMRNTFAVLAIALTTILITTVITLGITFYKTNKAYTIVSNYGIDSDGYVTVNNEGVNKLKSINNLDKIGVIKRASFQGVKNKELINEVVNLEASNRVGYDMMAIVPTEGSYPKSSEEALVPTWILDVLGVEKKIGEKITLDINIGNEIKTFDLKLCGYYESLFGRGSNNARVFVSEDFITKHNNEINEEDNTTAYVTFKNLKSNTSFSKVKEEVDKVGKEVGAISSKAHPKYDTDNTKVPVENISKQIVAGVFGVIIVIFTGYLIIYNIFHISITKDIRFYGLLKTIGTTSKQLRNLIFKQALILSIIGIPIGLILGYLIATYIVPLGLKLTFLGSLVVVTPNPYIFLLAALFSLLTVIISCRKPGKEAGKVSPIEAVRYVSSDVITSKKKSKKGINGAKIYKMAWSNIVKSKTRVILSIISISLSAVMVMFVINATMGIDSKKHANSQMTSDINIYNNIDHSYGDEEYKPIEEDIVNKVRALDVIKEVTPYYSVITPDENGQFFGFGAELKLQGKLKEELESNSNGYFGFNKISDDVIRTEVGSLDVNKLDKEIERISVIDGKIDKEEFKKGNYIIYYAMNGKTNVLKAGDTLPLTFILRDENGDVKEVKKEFNIMAIVTSKGKEAASNNFSTINLEENKFKDIFPQYKNYIKDIDIELKEGVDIKEADEIVSKVIMDSESTNMGIGSKNFYIEGMKNLQTILFTIGGIVSIILGIIGAINVTNTILTSIFSRRVEFAMLESIGMTKKQLKKMILFEGVYYILLSSLLIIPLGLLTALIAPMVLPIYGGVNVIAYIVSVVISILIISILMMTIPLVGYRLVSKESIVERLNIMD